MLILVYGFNSSQIILYISIKVEESEEKREENNYYSIYNKNLIFINVLQRPFKNNGNMIVIFILFVVTIIIKKDHNNLENLSCL